MKLERAGITDADIGGIDAGEIDGVAIDETGDRTGEMRDLIEHERAGHLTRELNDRIRRCGELQAAAVDDGMTAIADALIDLEQTRACLQHAIWGCSRGGYRRIDNQRMPATIVLNRKISQLVTSNEGDAVERLATRVVQGQRPGIVPVVCIGRLIYRNVGKIDVSEIDQIRIRGCPVPRKTDNLPREILGIIEHELAGVAAAVGEGHRRRACARDVQRLAAVDRHRAG